MQNILIIFYYGKYPPRTTIIDHLYSFQRHSGQRCFYLDLAVQNIPKYIDKIDFDLIIFHTIFLSARWHLPTFTRIVEKVRLLKGNPAIKIALPQDEFYRTDVVCDFINEFGIDHVFSVSPPSEWQKIYKTVDFQEVKFHPVLTGYLEETTMARIKRLSQTIDKKNIDIGYRAWQAEPWLGRHGFLKTLLAERFQDDIQTEDLNTDISTHPNDTILGDAWYDFLLRCKYTIGVEGGASILDWDGTLREKTNLYLEQYPNATFEEVELACFPDQDGSLSLFAISPRHLEACATKTCQILLSGSYNGILTAGKHYIELKLDFSNLDNVLRIIKNDTEREKIVENAYSDIVQSKKYTYSHFVEQILRISLRSGNTSKKNTTIPFLWWMNKLESNLAWVKSFMRGAVLYPTYLRFLNLLPSHLKTLIMNLENSWKSRK
jgi:hypothetical protein